MKKYFNIIVLPIFIVVVIGYFYTEVNSSSRHFPKFQFEKIAGNEEVVKDLIVTGEFYFELFGFEPFRVDSEGTSYFRDEPLLKSLKGYYEHLDIEKLQNDYRDFMRGKDQHSMYFYETDELLAYGSIPLDPWNLSYNEFEIAVLDKQTNKATSFSVPIPNQGDYSYIDIKQVYLIGSELHMITQHEGMDSNGSPRDTEVHGYTFDIERQELLSNDKIAAIQYSNTDKGYNDIRILVDEGSEGTIILFENEITFDDAPEQQLYRETVHTNKVIKYNLFTKEDEEIQLINDESIGIPIAILGSKLIFGQFEQNILEVTAYDIDESAIIGQVEVQTAEKHLTPQELYDPFVKEGKFYFVPSMSENKGTSLSVIDLESLEILYEGNISLVEPIDPNQHVSIHYNRLEWNK